jgi:hypothetical protein
MVQIRIPYLLPDDALKFPSIYFSLFFLLFSLVLCISAWSAQRNYLFSSLRLRAPNPRWNSTCQAARYVSSSAISG